MSATARINGVEVEMDPRDIPAFTFQVSDPLEPGSTRGTRSTSFKIPATNTARRELGSEVMSEHRSTEPDELRIGNAGQVYLSTKIRPVEWDREESRSVAVGNNASWMQELRNLKVNEMDLGESGPVNAANIIASWFDEDQLTYYPIIDYGYDWSSTTLGAIIENIRPGYRCHRIIEQALNDLGYSVKVKGALTKAWKKFVMPATRKPILAGDYLAGETLAIETQGPVIVDTITVIPNPPFHEPPWSPIVPFPPAPHTVTDPGGNNTNTFYYTTPLLMNLRVRIHMVIEVLAPPFYGETHGLFAHRTDTGDLLAPPTFVEFQGGQTYTLGLVLADLTIAGGTEVGVSMAANSPTTYRIHECRVVYEVYDIPYQEGVSVDMGKSAPKLSVLDVIQGIKIAKNIEYNTDDVSRTVTFYYSDNFYKDIAQGKSLRGREDHSDPPVKHRPLKPKSVAFKWKEDDKDEPLAELNTQCGERGWGGIIHEIEGGYLDAKTITLPFASTRMKMYPGSVFLPVIREDDAVNEPEYDWQPRLLIADGTTRGDWTLQGEAQQIYPKCYFVFPTEQEHGLSFFPEDVHGDTGAGAFELRWRKYFRRFDTSFLLEIDLWLWDYELARFDFGIPVEVSDGYTPGWYYFTKVEQKRFGVDEPTRCTLIKL